MLTDIFFKRYPQVFHGDRPTPPIARFFAQAAHIIFHDLAPKLTDPRQFFETIHNQLARELGIGRLGPGAKYDEICGRFLVEPYDLWNDGHGSTDYFIRTRLSFVEIAFRQFASTADKEQLSRQHKGFLASLGPPQSDGVSPDDIHMAIAELNGRFREAELPLDYHNGFIQFSSDDVTRDQLETPFWQVLSDSKWTAVDRDIKEAIDRRDTGQRDAAFYAMKALESAVKIVCDDKGWSSGKEKGAASLIDHLVSSKHGRFIDPWEADALKAMFRDIRNPHSHGAGTSAAPAFSDPQVRLVIEICMAWIKTLVTRM
jgi:hypothetical protein